MMNEHEVPTHLQAEDRILLGLTFPQLLGGVAVLGLAYGIWHYSPFTMAARSALAGVVAVLGLALTLLRPGGRPLPACALDLLRFVLEPKHYNGSLGDLAHGTTASPKPPKKQKRNLPFTGRTTKGLPFRCVSIFLCLALLVPPLLPHAALASWVVINGQRLFIEALDIQDQKITLTIRAATALKVLIAAEVREGEQPVQFSGVLYQGEVKQYELPLNSNHPVISIAWQDGLGTTGVEVLDGKRLPYPLPHLQG